MPTSQGLTTTQLSLHDSQQDSYDPDKQIKQKRQKRKRRSLSKKLSKQQVSKQTQRQKKVKQQNRSIQQLNNNSSLKRIYTTSKPQQRQIKLNYFIIKKAQNDSSCLSQQKYAIPQFQRKKAALQTQLKSKDILIQKLKFQRENTYQKYRKMSFDLQQNKIRNKKIIQQQLRQAANDKRREKAEINPKMGLYKQTAYTVFVEGEYIQQAKKKVQNIQARIQAYQETKKNLKPEQRQRVNYQIQFAKKEKNQALQVLKFREIQLTAYKDRLRLAQKQSNCTFAKNHWALVNERFLPLELLGQGGFGQVYKCYDLDQNNYVALKTNCFEPIKNSERIQQFLKHVHREIHTLKNLHHQNIARLIQQIQIDNNKISFIMQYCSGPQLSKYLLKWQFLQQKQARGIIRQISFALKYMFDQKTKIIHYDLKPANIIFHHGMVKVIDFGLCKKMESEETKIDLTSQGVGTYWYLPPETFFANAEISSKVDVWSLGVIFYQILYGRKPFGNGINQNKIYTEGIILKANKVEFPTDKKFKVTQQAKNFICECLKYNVQQRLDPAQVYDHPYLNN